MKQFHLQMACLNVFIHPLNWVWWGHRNNSSNLRPLIPAVRQTSSLCYICTWRSWPCHCFLLYYLLSILLASYLVLIFLYNALFYHLSVNLQMWMSPKRIIIYWVTIPWRKEKSQAFQGYFESRSAFLEFMKVQKSTTVVFLEQNLTIANWKKKVF